jgi:HemK-like putative methylase
LIPRVETEEWSINLANLLSERVRTRKKLKILDLCTGTGCIPLLLCRLLPPGEVNALAIDISSHACQLARENAESTGFHYNNHERKARNMVRILQADMLATDFKETLGDDSVFDVITCNPPYIAHQQYLDLPESVKGHEDYLALVGSMIQTHQPSEFITNTPNALLPEEKNQVDGLAYYRSLRKLIPLLLKPSGGIFAAEFGVFQSDPIRCILGNSGLFKDLRVWKDSWGIDRVVVGNT